MAEENRKAWEKREEKERRKVEEDYERIRNIVEREGKMKKMQI